MKLYYEVVVKDILPNVRSAIAKELIFSHKMNQTEVARCLGVSQPAVSQYVREIRGRKALDGEDTVNCIKILAEKIFKNEIDQNQLSAELCNICDMVRANG